MFECANGFCVLLSLVCDHFDDCGDDSDEQGCGKDESNSLSFAGCATLITMKLLS